MRSSDGERRWRTAASRQITGNPEKCLWVLDKGFQFERSGLYIFKAVKGVKLHVEAPENINSQQVHSHLIVRQGRSMLAHSTAAKASRRYVLG